MLGFGSSTSLAAAYGIAVTGTMAITTVLAFVVARRDLGIGSFPPASRFSAHSCWIDVGFFSANVVKIVEGGWFPLAFGLGVFVLMSTWKRGRELLYQRIAADSIPLADFVRSASLECTTIPGTAVFMTANPDVVPHALLWSLKKTLP